MQHPPLETIAARLSELLHCGQEDLCRPIIQHVARGKPVTKAETFLSTHPEAVLLSVEEAALVGRWVAQSHFTETQEAEGV
jgi:hypothetical protein